MMFRKMVTRWVAPGYHREMDKLLIELEQTRRTLYEVIHERYPAGGRN